MSPRTPAASVSWILYSKLWGPVPPRVENKQAKGTPGTTSGGQTTESGIGGADTKKVRPVMKVVRPRASETRTAAREKGIETGSSVVHTSGVFKLYIAYISVSYTHLTLPTIYSV